MFNRKLYKFILPVALLLFTAGCKKFLDAPSRYQIKADDVFTSEQGFQQALDGVYLQIGAPGLYGKELQYGFLSVLAHSWDTTIRPQIGDLYYQAARYNYAHPAVKTVIGNIWDSSYSAILNINVALGKIDEKKDVLSVDGYNAIKSELLGLRAYLHFDLLRMFGPDNPASNLSVAVMPYMDKVSTGTSTYLPANDIIDRCINDLKAAKAIASQNKITRGRIGYWGLTGLLARIYLYKADYTNAAANAGEVINSGKFPLATSSADFQYLNELLFSVYISAPHLTQYEKSILNSTPSLGLSVNGQNIVFVAAGGSLNDWRKLSQFITTNGTTTPAAAVMLTKKLYFQNSSMANVLPMIRFTEMYYIAAECANVNKDTTTAMSLLNKVRQARNFPANSLTNLSQAAVQTEIQKEYMKEFLGEGQAFFYFKRMNLDINNLPLTKVSPVPGAVYAFPVPE